MLYLSKGHKCDGGINVFSCEFGTVGLKNWEVENKIMEEDFNWLVIKEWKRAKGERVTGVLLNMGSYEGAVARFRHICHVD